MLPPLILAGVARGQKDVTIETLARALEGRLGVYARNLVTGSETALNADQPYAAGDLAGAFGPESRRSAQLSGAATPEKLSPRALVDRLVQRHAVATGGFDPVLRKKLVQDADRTLLGASIPPTVEAGAATTGQADAPGIVGYARTREGTLAFCVMASEFRSPYTAAAVFPEVIGALFRRHVPGLVEPPVERKVPGLLLASIHEKRQDSKLFPAAPDAAVADLRRGDQRLTFSAGDIVRVCVLARPERDAVVTVQWWSPAESAEARESRVLDGRRLGDAVCDLQVHKLGSWRARVAFDDIVVLDEIFYVTAK